MPARHHQPRHVSAVVCAWAVVALVAGVPASAGADGVTVTGTAGAGGVSKPGRWTPISVTVEASGEGAAGVLAVGWGGAVAERPVSVPAGARKRFDFYLQTMDVAGAVTAALRRDGLTLAAADLPVRVLSAVAPFTLCVADPVIGGAAGTDCTAVTTAAALPRSLRGYDAVDRVSWLGGSEQQLPADQRLALARWRAVRALDDEGSLAATDRPPSIMPALARRNRASAQVRLSIAAFLLLLVTAAAATRRRRPRVVYAAVLIAIACGAGASLADGRAGPGAVVRIHHATLLQQLPGSNGSLITMRGAVEYPSFDSYAVQAALADAAVQTDAGQLFAENGYPLLRGTFGAGARQVFALEGASDIRPLAITRHGGVVRVANASAEDLLDCRFADGSSVKALDALRAGAAVETVLREAVVGPVVTCTAAHLPVEFADGRHAVQLEGRTLVAAYLDPAGDGAR